MFYRTENQYVLRLLAAFLFPLVTVMLLFCASTVHAHPLGNYSINQYLLVDMRGEAPEVLYLLDMAEIPSFTEMDLLDTDFDSVVSPQEVQDYLDAKVPLLAGNIAFSINGEPISLTVSDQKLVLLEGTGGMVVFNVLLELQPKEPRKSSKTGPLDFEVVSLNYPDAQGIRECKVVTDGLFMDLTASLGKEVLKYQTRVFLDDDGNSVFQDFDCQFRIRLGPGTGKSPATEKQPVAFEWTATARAAREAGESAIVEGMASNAQTAAKNERQPEPVVRVEQGAVEKGEPELLTKYSLPNKGDEGETGRLLSRVSEIIRTKEVSLPLFMAGLLIAMALGAVHAFSPGHGKTVVAAYLFGERATYRHAVLLGLVVTITHTWSVLLLGAVTLYASEAFSEEGVNFWMGIVSGCIIAVIGVSLFFQRYKTFLLVKHGATQHHNHHHHGNHHHQPKHSADPSTQPEDTGPASFTKLLWLGISGGIVPCPGALVVLLLALKFERAAYGFWLILAFSFGTAAVLTAMGLVVVRVSKELRKRARKESIIIRTLPVLSSILIAVLGAWVVLWTLLQYNVIVFMPGR